MSAQQTLKSPFVPFFSLIKILFLSTEEIICTNSFNDVDLPVPILKILL